MQLLAIDIIFTIHRFTQFVHALLLQLLAIDIIFIIHRLQQFVDAIFSATAGNRHNFYNP
jgi:hypothetical protein